MRIGYLECFAGISGDMFLGALLDAGVKPVVLHQAVAALNLGAQLEIKKVDRSGITSTKVNVLLNGELAEAAAPTHDHSHEHEHTHEDGTTHTHSQGDHEHTHDHEHSHEHTHTHADGTTHSHDHAGHGRSLTVIRNLIQQSSLDPAVKALAIRAFELLGASEAKIHNVPLDQIHFHEVGAVDAIVDIVASAAGIVSLNIDKWICSPLNVGGGMVECAHGTFPVPAPATADLLRNVPTYSAHLQKELVTPTGAALIRALTPDFTTQPMIVKRIGYGAGTRNPAGFPNVLRLSIGESTSSEALNTPTDTVIVLECAVDDLSPELLGSLSEQAMSAGALDILFTPAQMKKNRPGTLITILASEATSTTLQTLLFKETSTLGIRIREERRLILKRRTDHVKTEYGTIHMKVGILGDEEVNIAPEFEDCRAAAKKHNVPVKQVMQAALAHYHAAKTK